MLDKLVEILKKQSGPDQKAIVFCNSVKSCTWAANHLVVNGISVAKYHGGIHPVVSQSFVMHAIHAHQLFQIFLYVQVNVLT